KLNLPSNNTTTVVSGPIPQESQGSGAMSKSPVQRRKSLMLRIPAPKNKAPQKTRKAAEITRNSSEAMPPPRATHSITAQLSRQSTQEEPDPLTNEEPTTPPTKSVSARKKLLVSASSSRLR
ncbi:hypothetical protein BDM02DRAFT_3127043, partial [Thelephora ganbajun]